MKKSEIIKQSILDACATYYFEKKEEDKQDTFNKINYAGRVYSHKEIQNAVEASLEFYLTHSKWCNLFEKKLSEFLGVKYSLLVNSGSSANLLAFLTLTSHSLGENRIKRGDKVICVASCFPTSVTPIIQYGAIPVFVDIDINTLNINVEQLRFALSDKTKAIFIAHTLGNPFNLDIISQFCDDNNLWLIADCCDSLGSRYKGESLENICDIATSSFFPAHHICLGESGAVHTNNSILKVIMQSIRDWGKDCSCSPGTDNKCGNRFSGQYGEMPQGFDHKYIFSEFGLNLKVTEMQGAIGVAQLEKLTDFIKARKENWNKLYEGLKQYSDLFIFQQAEECSDPSWFGFTFTLTDKCNFTRYDIVKYIEDKGIQTRLLFAGNIIKQPMWSDLINGLDYIIIGGNELVNTNKVMNDTFWIGVYPGMTNEKINYMITTIKEFVNEKT